MNNPNRVWILTCFGTAVGTGILFLPIRAGLSGICPILFLTLIIFPITYISHKGITRIVASCPKETDIVGAVEYDLGHTTGFIVSILYFLSIATTCVGYATALTNMLDALLTNHFHIYLSRPFLTFVILVGMTAVMLCNKKVMVIVTSIFTFPLIIMLLAVSLYMIPKWNLSTFYQVSFNLKCFIKNTLLLLPILIFAMNFSPVCSSLGAFYKKNFTSTEDAIKNSDHVVKWTSILLLVFVMFFVLSLFFSINPKILLNAGEKNIDALTAIAIAYNTPIFLYSLPIIAFLAISSSYFGHFEGAREGVCGIIKQLATWNNTELKEKINIKKIKMGCTIILVALLWIFTVYNLPVLSIISVVSSPIIAIYAYLMPVIFMKKVPRLRIYQSKWAAFVFVIGIITIVGYCLGQVM
ncbi:MAG: amino acid permease [Endomicrobium sp.]|nr:amino acid permease [Endomicrobium sp.]